MIVSCSTDCLQVPLNIGVNVQSDLLTIPICVFGGEEVRSNVETNLKRYEMEITEIKRTGVVNVRGEKIPVLEERGISTHGLVGSIVPHSRLEDVVGSHGRQVLLLLYMST